MNFFYVFSALKSQPYSQRVHRYTRSGTFRERYVTPVPQSSKLKPTIKSLFSNQFVTICNHISRICNLIFTPQKYYFFFFWQIISKRSCFPIRYRSIARELQKTFKTLNDFLFSGYIISCDRKTAPAPRPSLYGRIRSVFVYKKLQFSFFIL